MTHYHPLSATLVSRTMHRFPLLYGLPISTLALPRSYAQVAPCTRWQTSAALLNSSILGQSLAEIGWVLYSVNQDELIDSLVFASDR